MSDQSQPSIPPVKGRRIPYNEIRDRYLAQPPETETQDLIRFAEIGIFVFERWTQIADDHQAGEDIDESKSDHRWDDCTEADLKRIRTTAKALVNREVGRQGAVAFAKEWMYRVEPISGVFRALSWVFMEAFRGFVGAIGILIFGLIFLWAAPSVTKAFRSAIDDVAPKETRAVPQTKFDPGNNN